MISNIQFWSIDYDKIYRIENYFSWNWPKKVNEIINLGNPRMQPVIFSPNFYLSAWSSDGNLVLKKVHFEYNIIS